MKILLTGAAGFIGFHLSLLLLEKGYEIIGLDNVNDYYDTNLKEDRIKILNNVERFRFYREDLKNYQELSEIFKKEQPEIVINLAAQAGIRHSITNPFAYVDSNLVGFVNILELCRHFKIKHLLFASSSSVYGGNKETPFATNHNVDHPISLYAATKKSNELMAHTYSHLYGIPVTGLRFFTVYGAWGRPDMAYFSFTKDIFAGKTIKVFNYGKLQRDFTYIDDITEGIARLINRTPQANNSWDERTDGISTSFAPYKIYNIGNNQPVELLTFIKTLEDIIGIEAKKEFCEMQAGDVLTTYADVTDLQQDIDFHPNTPLKKGLTEFVKWYRNYYNL
ncbi:MAG TPA: NAD-dependent epimerase [Candidatus Cloacimonadota bacterium]|nr:NAD-dependent epimerase [Candidatus Cloacimonadota bacterium]HOQ79813.1 NAD-dependent epimerase [Candidatus Cloacimonadota bacterium]HPK40441.1 NAD-dependent epimerase [Candidatus Cloacimonadota bacterium]